jgi:hypothetical protein
MARSRKSRQRGRGAVAAIKANVAASTVKHPAKPRTGKVTSGPSANQRIRGVAGGAPDYARRVG